MQVDPLVPRRVVALKGPAQQVEAGLGRAGTQRVVRRAQAPVPAQVQANPGVGLVLGPARLPLARETERRGEQLVALAKVLVLQRREAQRNEGHAGLRRDRLGEHRLADATHADRDRRVALPRHLAARLAARGRGSTRGSWALPRMADTVQRAGARQVHLGAPDDPEPAV